LALFNEATLLLLLPKRMLWWAEIIDPDYRRIKGKSKGIDGIAGIARNRPESPESGEKQSAFSIQHSA